MNFFRFNKSSSLSGGKSRKKLVITSFILALSLLGTTFMVAAQGGGESESVGLLGDSSNQTISASSLITLGESTTQEIYTAEDLVQLSQRVADGEDISGLVFILMNDIDLRTVEAWVPIGTVANPFNASFEGNNYTVSGVGSAAHPSLFGYIKGAILQNILVKSIKIVRDMNPYEGLFLSMELSSVQNCEVTTSPITLSRSLMSYSMPGTDDSWYGTPGAVSIDSPARLLSVAEKVTAGDSLAGYDLNLNVTMTDAYNAVWKGIGDDSTPFMGVATGEVRNFKPNKPGIAEVGLFGRTNNATIYNLKMVGADVVGGDRTGAIVGYAIDTKISNCSVSGSVSGANEVGGLVGCAEYTDALNTDASQYAFDTSAGTIDSLMHTIYSSANVSGIYQVGGLVGKISSTDVAAATKAFYVIRKGFSTGNVSGVIAVGGITGYTGGSSNNANVYVMLKDVAASGTISGSGSVGGISGQVFQGHDSTAADSQTAQAYFSGTVYAYGYVGGLIGANYDTNGVPQIGAKNSYVSGHVVVPDASDEHAWQAFGSDGFTAAPADGAINVWIGPNSVYSNTDIMNASGATYKKTVDSSGKTLSAEYRFLDDNPMVALGFTSHGLGYAAGVNDSRVPTTGSFPTLDEFTGAPGDAFDTFSKISTNVNTRIPSYLYYDAVTKQLYRNVTKTALYKLDTVGGLMSWSINGQTSGTVEITDETLVGNNSIILEADRSLTLKEAPHEDTEIVIASSVSTFGIKTEQTVTIIDSSVRPVYASAYSKFHEKAADAGATGANTFSTKDYFHYISFPESVRKVNPAFTLDLIQYTNNAFTTVAATTPINFRVVGDTNIRFEWASTDIDFDKFYAIRIPAGVLEDYHVPAANNNQDIYLYFATVSTKQPTITFIGADPLAVAGTTTATTQTIRMQENDSRFVSLFNDIRPEAEGYVDLERPGNAVLLSIDKTMAGKDTTYPPVGSININNFTSVAGTYKVQYTITDDFGVISNPIVRTYEIYSPAKVTQGGQPYKLLRIAFDDKQLIEIYNNSISSGITTAQALNKAIEKRYVNTAGIEQVKAFRYDYNAVTEPLVISFDTSSAVPNDDSFIKGMEVALEFDTSDGDKHIYILSLASLEPSREIRLANTTLIAENEFTKYQARQHFGAEVFNKETETIQRNEPIYYDFSKVNPKVLDRPQEVTLSLSKNPVIIAGVDVTVSTKATIIIKRVIKYKHPEDKEDEVRRFWDDAELEIKNGLENRVHNLDMSYLSGDKTYTDFFRVVANREGITANLKLPSGITLTVDSNSIDKSKIDGMIHNYSIERRYNVFVDRDANGAGTQQFTTEEGVVLPGEVIVSMPLDERLQNQNRLKLFRIDSTSGNYVLIKELSDDEVSDETLTLKIKQYEGNYVVSSANLDGKTASTDFN